MKNSVSALLLAFGLIGFNVIVSEPAQAQQSGSFFGQEQFYDTFVDGDGRRFLVDPETGEVVGRANPNARFTRRDQQRAQREFRRELRRGRLERELGTLFGLDNRRDDRPRQRRRESDQNSDRNFQQRGQPRQRRWFERPQRAAPAPVQPSQPLTRQEEVARLPDLDAPVKQAPELSGMPKPQYSKSQMAALQVFLDREGFSPGSIDGRWGSNVAKAAASWMEAKGGKQNLGNEKTLNKLLSKTGADVLTTYTITQKDVAGPFVASVPVDYGQKAKLERLSYTSVAEMLAERFHMSERYLKELNAGKNLNRAGTTIRVVATGKKVAREVHYIVADKGRKQVRAFDRNGKLVASYPATIGSAATPSPTGTHAVQRIAVNPEYTYNPKINFTQGDNKKILRIAPGPNGPVGSVWIALSKPTYGIHGTPNPDAIGKTNSNGCIRLTNWDALELAKIVRKGVTVEFVE